MATKSRRVEVKHQCLHVGLHNIKKEQEGPIVVTVTIIHRIWSEGDILKWADKKDTNKGTCI